MAVSVTPKKLTGQLRTKTSIQASSLTVGSLALGDIKGADSAFALNLLSDNGSDVIRLISDNKLSILGADGLTTSIDADNNALTITLEKASTTEFGGASFDSSYFVVDSDGVVSISSVGDPIAVTKGGTGIVQYAKGDILFASDFDVLEVLPVGNEGEFMMISGTGTPYWTSVFDGGSF